MPYTIKPGSFKYKKSNGQFSEIDCFEGPDLTEEVAALEKGKAPIIIDSDTGNPIMIKDGADDLPVEGMKIHFSPIQSGTGDPSPSNIRPISGFDEINIFRTGINIWDEELELGGINSSTGIPYTSTTALRAKNYIPVTPGAKYYFKSSSTSSTRCWYDKDKNYISTGYVVNLEITAPDNAYFFRFDLPSSYGTTYNHDISLNYPSTDTEYHPYTGQSYPVTFPVLGKNLFDELYPNISTGASVIYYPIYVGENTVTLSTTAPRNTGSNHNLFLLSGNVTTGASSSANGVSSDQSRTVTATNGYVTIGYRTYQGVDPREYKTQLEKGSTATAYEPYTNTIYGGTLDAVNGVLTVTHKCVVYDGSSDETWNFFDVSTGNLFRTFQVDRKSGIMNLNPSNYFCNSYTMAENTSTGRTNGKMSGSYTDVDFINDSCNSIESWREYLAENPIQFVYLLATPIEIQLDSVTVTTLLGDNTIWSDANGNIELDYRADTKLFVDQNNPVTDVQVKGASLVQNGIANIPLAQMSTPGLMMTGAGYGLKAADINGNSAGRIQVDQAWPDLIKAFSEQYRPITPKYLPDAVFHGLARAAGDTTQSASANAVGTFTPDAIVAIQKMLGVYQPPFELIRNITLSERSSVIITTDDDGLPLNLMSLFMEITYPANLESETAGYGRYMFYDNSGSSACLMAETTKYTTNSNATFKLLELSCKANMKFLRYTTQTTTGYHGAWYSKAIYTSGPRSMLLDYGNIARIAMNSSDYEPAGTQIRIWGQRAY